MTPEAEADDFASAGAQRLRRRALRAAQRAFFRTGLDRLYASVSRARGVVVLLYHSVPDRETERFIDPANRMDQASFERQMRFLACERRVLALDAVVEVIRGKLRPEPGSVAVTLDDGYRDNLTFVAPLLESLGIPATLYLPTRLVARGDSPWADLLYSAFRHRTRDRLHLPSLRAEPFALDLPDERRRAYRALTSKLIETDLATRRALLDQALAALSPSELPPRLLMNWQDVRELKQRHPWLRLGVHGAEHLDMSSQPEPVLDEEILNSKRDFEGAVGEPAFHFAYPYNRADERSRRALERHALHTAMATGSECLVGARADALRIPRLDAPRDLDLLGHWTSGAHPALSRSLLRRS